MNSANGTCFYACATAGTLGMIEKGKILVHCDSAVGTCACALGASDTSVCAHLAGESALVVVRASDSDDGTVFLHLDGAVRTGLCTKSATGAEARDDLCYAICDEDSIIGTSSCAVAKTDAGKGTNVFSLPMLCGIATGSEAVAEMLFILLGRLAGAVASNVSKELDGLSCLNAENVCDFLRSSIATGNTEVGFSDLTFGEGASVAVASAESASSAVGTGESIADSEELFILLNTEKDV